MTTTSATRAALSADQPAGIDPRGARFTAAVTAGVLLTVLLLADAAPGVATAVIGAQALLFALGAARGVQATPTAYLFKRLVRPRLGPPAELEDPRPPRFAQTIGLVFAGTALVGFLAGLTTLALVATGLALTAALLNAAFGLCLGCELYLLGKRATAGRAPSRT